jgi:hypothetical protein
MPGLRLCPGNRPKALNPCSFDREKERAGLLDSRKTGQENRFPSNRLKKQFA